MKKVFKFTALILLMSSAFGFTSCQKESNITKVCVLKTVDSLNLYLTAAAKGNISSHYVYLGNADAKTSTVDNLKKYSEEVFNKANKDRPNCDIAYFPINSDEQKGVLKSFFSEYNTKLSENNKFKPVYIDSYNDSTKSTSELTPTGIWIGRSGWIKNSGTSKKFIAGLAKTANYRVSEMIKYSEDGKEIKKTTNDAYEMAYRDFANESWTSFADMYKFIDENQNRLPDFMFNDKNDKIVNYKSIYEYTALFALQNKNEFSGDNLEIFKNTSAKDNYGKPFINNETAIKLFGEKKDVSKDSETDIEISADGKALLNNLSKELGLGDDYTKSIETNLMRYGIYQTSHQTESKGDMKKVIMISAISGSVLLIVVGLLIFRRVKTGKKLFDIQRALDVDIPLDNPRIIRRKDTGADLKQMRVAKGMSLEEAAKVLRIHPRRLELDYESGDLMVPKRLQKRFIELYKLPENFFEAAYNAPDVK